LGGNENGSSSDSESAGDGAYSSDASSVRYGEDPADFSSESDYDAGSDDATYLDNACDSIVDDRMDVFDFRGRPESMEDNLLCGACSDVSDEDV